MVLLSLKTLEQLLREEKTTYTMHESYSMSQLHIEGSWDIWDTSSRKVENVIFAKSAALISNRDYMWHWLCPILCTFAKQKKQKEQNRTDDSTVDLTAPQCCLVHWEGIKRLQDVAMEGNLEGAIFFPLMVQQICTAAFPKMDKDGSAGGESCLSAGHAEVRGSCI